MAGKVNLAEMKTNVMNMGFDEVRFNKKDVFIVAMKKYNGTPIFFGLTSAFAYDYDYDDVPPETPDWATIDNIENAIKKKAIDVNDLMDEPVTGVALVAAYNPVEEIMYDGLSKELLSSYLNLTDADVVDIQGRIDRLCKMYVKVENAE